MIILITLTKKNYIKRDIEQNYHCHIKNNDHTHYRNNKKYIQREILNKIIITILKNMIILITLTKNNNNIRDFGQNNHYHN